jgi:hypothetical protein
MMAALNRQEPTERARRRPRPVPRGRATALVAALSERTGRPDRFLWPAGADALLAGPLALLLATQQAVERVAESICTNADALPQTIRTRTVGRPLDGDQC